MSISQVLTLAQNSGGGGGAMGALGALFGFVIMIGIVLAVGALLFWKVFEKAGQPGWMSVVPLLNVYVLCKVAGRPGWWLVLLFIPIVNIIVTIIVSIDVAKAFGKGTGFGIGLWLLGIIFYPILGFGSAQYQGPAPTPLPGVS